MGHRQLPAPSRHLIGVNPGRVAARGLGDFTLPPPMATVKVEAPVTLNMDGQKVADGLLNLIVSGGKGAIGGSPYFDPSTGPVPFDLIH
jgi:hypothetical protein